MYWLLLSIITNSILLLLLKAFARFGVNTLQAIVVNYFVAGSVGLFVTHTRLMPGELLQQPYAWVPPTLGLLFISIFLLIARTAQTIGVSVATVANKMSVVIPVVAALLLYDESIGLWKIVGLLLAIAAVYFTSVPKEKQPHKAGAHFWLPAIVFLGSGAIDALVNHAKTRLVPDAHLAFFLSACFLCAGMLGICIAGYRVVAKKERIEGKNVLAGIVLGIPNYFSIYGMTRALGSNLMESSALYPVNNMGIVAVSAVSAWIIFKEKLSVVNWLGIVLSIAAIALIAFG